MNNKLTLTLKNLYISPTEPFGKSANEKQQFEKGDKFCILPTFFLDEYYKDKIDINDPEYYIECITNKTTRSDLIVETLYRLRKERNEWIYKEIEGGTVLMNGTFTRENGIWYYNYDT